MADPKLLIKPKKGEWRVTGVQFHVPSGYDSWSTPDPSERALTIMLSNGQGEGCYLVLGSARNMRDWIAKRFKQLTSERFVSGTHFWSALSEIDVSGLVSSKYQAEAKAFAATLAEELGLQFRDRTPVHFWGERGRDGGYVLHGIKSGEQQYTVVSFTALQALATSMSEVCKLAFPGRSNPLLAN